MNQQGSGYSQYYLNPYPNQQTTPYPGYAAPQQAQQFFRPFPQNAPTPQQQPRRQPLPTPVTASRQNGQNLQQAVQDGSPPADPGAPPPDRSSPDLEDRLRNALQQHQQPGQNHDNNDEDEQNDDADDPNEPVFAIPAPPEGNYAGEAELEKSLHAWSLEHGYDMVRRASKKNAIGKIYKHYYNCSKHGKLANTGKPTATTGVRRKRKSKRTGCPMGLAAVAVYPSNPEGEWQIRHRTTHHNHGPVEAVALAGHRRRARMGGVEKAVDGLFAIGTPGPQVLQFLQRTKPDGLFTMTDVANMKLKWKKYGTSTHLVNQFSRDPEKALGLPSACLRCRDKRVRCDSARPTCQHCIEASATCDYDHEPGQEHPNTQGSPDEAQDDSLIVPNSAVRRRQILQDLQSFQAEYVKPKRLELNSSSVEVLAHSSCGNGDSYKSIPTLQGAGDWQTYSDSFIEASLKENTIETLTGAKTEPIRPQSTEEGQEVEVEDWNEYVKQLAIFHRRNFALLGALLGSLAPSFRTRIQGFNRASEAWRALEEMCCPRGSDQAFKLYMELHSITLQSCGGELQSYIGCLETAWHNFSRLKQSQQYPHGRHHAFESTPQHKNATLSTRTPGTGAEVVSEEALCFLFLRNLGDGYRRWVDTLCQTSNIGGFGTGFKIGFRDLTKRAVEWEGMQRRSG
ncbi:Uu.00g116820.m01.CDS01 [Anthostomella pinea]|uniref:Uu.00g116820.m01.CDS01 n=1 Tax=Anthostomella pinea TaxID=933095 RepID=A0AAI8YEG2_9PEZI|nr:Uu.00g116820.m01.CDS01 [Anthostomella pinea]